MDLYPAALRPEIDALNERVYETVNNGTYQVAGATTQADYERLGAAVATFAELDDRLAGRRFLFGGASPRLTSGSGRRWPGSTWLQPAGKISERPLTSYPNLWGYARDLYQRPAFRDTTDFGAFGMFGAGRRPSFFNDAPWRIRSSRCTPTGTARTIVRPRCDH